MEERKEYESENILVRIAKSFYNENVFWKSEIEGNKLTAVIMLSITVVLFLVWIGNYFGVFSVDDGVMNRVAVWGTVEMLVPVGLCYHFKGEKSWLKYIMVIELVIVLARLDSLFTFNVHLLMAIPVVLSIRYFSRSFTLQISIITSILFIISALCGTGLGLGEIDMNYYFAPADTLIQAGKSIYQTFSSSNVIMPEYVKIYMQQSFIPKYLIFVQIAIASVRIAAHGHSLVKEQAEISAKSARIESELLLAADIQDKMLPNNFTEFSEREEFDIFAMMDPAKEIGGDLYDMFLVDDNHLAVVIADVSGKGVPASLFMVVAKILIKNHVQLGLEPAEVFNRVNNLLCDNNETGLFVTSWLGILDLKTGVMKYVNAGHNPPLLKLSSDKFEYLKQKPCFVLAGMEDIPYRQEEFQMHSGDRLFLYTDGVTEATDPEKQLYGEVRLRDYMNHHVNTPLEDVIHGLRQDIDDFDGNTEQFDDITMLIIEYKKAD